MNIENFNDGLNNIDPAIVENFIMEKERHTKKRLRRRFFRRITALAACLCLTVTAVLALPSILKTTNETRPATSNPQVSAPPPAATGSQIPTSSGWQISGQIVEHPEGISVTARATELFTDTYTIYEDSKQREYHLVKMEVIKKHSGVGELTEFYYLIPDAYMTDFTKYDSFVLIDMGQLSYDYFVLYNKTNGTLEQFNLILFGYGSNIGFDYMSDKFAAYDKDGNLDVGLWESTDAWKDSTEGKLQYTFPRIEAQQGKGEYKGDSNREPEISILTGLTDMAKEELQRIKNSDNGIYIPQIRTKMYYGLSFRAVKYINGFATNESAEFNSYYDETYWLSNANFDEADLQNLPDLPSAIDKLEQNKHSITPPHITSYASLKLTDREIFAWYAKTDDGVVGVMRCTLKYASGEIDDVYFIVEQGKNGYARISRDDLLLRMGSCEKSFIYSYEYTDKGQMIFSF